MGPRSEPRRSILAAGIFGLLDPIPFGCFVAALIFDITYAENAVILWLKGAAWLIVLGLLFAIVPRLINLVQVWITWGRAAPRSDKLAFWLNLGAVVLAIVNAFVHSRDAYAVMPTGAWLSACTVGLLAVGHVIVAAHRVTARAYANE